MKNKNKLVIIYLPNGNEIKYCTKDIGTEYTLAEEIICDPGEVKIVVKQDNKLEGYSYVGMPYFLNMF